MRGTVAKRFRQLADQYAEKTGRTSNKFVEQKVCTKQMFTRVVNPITCRIEKVWSEVACYVIRLSDGPRFIKQRLKKLWKAGKLEFRHMENLR